MSSRHPVTLTVYSHADATKTAAIRKALEAAASLPPQTSTSSKFGLSAVVPSRSGAFGGLGSASDGRTRTGSGVVGGGEYWLPYVPHFLDQPSLARVSLSDVFS